MPDWTKEQKEAIEKSGTNIIVSAGAGSGKTAVLTERVLEKLNNGIHLNELLILTFTKAAAEEMKDRIRKKINKSEELINELKYIDSAYITTFDSFSLSVLKRYHYVLNLPKDIKISDEIIVKINKKQIFNKVFDSYYEKNNENFYKLIEKFCLKNDKSLRESIFEISEKIDGFINRKDYLLNIKTNFYNDNNFDKFKNEFLELINSKKEIVNLEIENLSYYFDEDYILKIKEVVNPLLNTSSYDDFCKYLKVSLPRVPNNTEEEAKEAKNKLKKALDELLSLNIYSSINNLKNDFYKNKDAIIMIVDILEEYYSDLEKYKLENNIFTFQDVALLSIRLVKEYDYIKDELKDSFKEIMIDEYQDTNDIQETFISYISNNNVYMVGDIKQSIYRFRGSNPSIFKDKYELYKNNNNGYKIDLIKNFRSRNEVLDNINLMFGFIMDKELGGAEYKESHEMIYGNNSYDEEKLDNFDYNLDVLEYQKDEEKIYSNSEIEIFTIASDIKNKIQSKLQVFDKDTKKLRNIKYSDFVIILDRSKYFDDYKKIFEYEDIPLTIVKDGNLNSGTDLLLIKNIVELIIKISRKEFDITFKYDFMSIGRSFLYEYNDDYLFDIVTNNKYNETSLYNDLSNIENYNSKTSFELFNYILNQTDFYNKLYKIGDYENRNVILEKVSNLAIDLSNMNLSFEEFNDYLKEIIDNDYSISYNLYNDNSDSVKILTIHKSKGLEYPICYFADLDHDFNKKELNSKFISSLDYGIITSLLDKDEDNNFVKDLYKNKFNEEEISEKIRLFYVALTRAREKIIIVLPEKDSDNLEKNNNGVFKTIRRLNFKSLSDFVYSTKKYMKKFYKKINYEDIKITKDYLFNKPIKELNVEYEEDEFRVENISIKNEIKEQRTFSKNLPKLLTKEEINNMEYGTHIHELLEYANLKENKDLDFGDEFINNKINKFKNNEILRNIQEANIYHEYEFLYENDGVVYHGVIDLLLEYNDHIDIIDFKLKNVLDDAYKKQLDGYKKYVSKKSNKSINIYLYSIMDEEFTLI